MLTDVDKISTSVDSYVLKNLNDNASDDQSTTVPSYTFIGGFFVATMVGVCLGACVGVQLAAKK